MVHKRFVVFFFLVLLTGTAFFSVDTYGADLLDGQTPPVFEQLTRETGLSNMSVSSILQDKDGFLWFGTQGGLNRYDGRQMIVMRNDPFESEGLVHNLIQTMTYDPKNHEIWIGTYQGISRYNIYQNTFTNYSVEEHGLSNSVIVSIALDADGLVWVGTLSGLNSLDPDTGNVKNYTVEGDVVRSVFLASNNTLYLGTHAGLQMYDPDQDQVVATDYPITAPAVMLIRENNPGILTLGLWEGGLMTIDLNTGKTEEILFEDNRVYTYIKTSDGIQWVGTWGGGLFALTPDGHITQFSGTLPDGDVHHGVIYSLYQDDSDILWIGTNGGGITKVNPFKRNYVRIKPMKDVSDSLSNGKNNLIFRDRYQQLWTAIYNQGIERIDEATSTTIKYNDKERHALGDSVICYLDHPEWPLLVGSIDGISYYDVESDQFYPLDIPIPEGNLVYALTLDHKGRLWIGTYREGVYVYNPVDESLIQYHHTESVEGKENELSDNLIYSLLSDSQGRMWVGTNNGLNLLDPNSNKFHTFKREDGEEGQLPNNTIRKIFEDSNGAIWIATVGGGIAQYQEDTGQFISYTETHGLGNNTVSGILEDDHKRLWLATLDGLSVLDLNTHAIYTLLPEDGIGDYEFNAGHFKDLDGSLYFGGSHGITVIPKDFKRLTTTVPTLYIDGFSVLGKPYPNETPFFNDLTLSLSPNENFVGFKFIALDFDAPEKVKYFYRLIGQNKNFVANGQYNQAVFSNLPSGTYTFEVYAVTSREMMTDTVSMTFTIDKHWYQTPYAYMFYILLLFLLIYVVIRLRERNIMALKNSELNQVNVQLAVANQQLEKLSILDSLTGVFNRRHFDQIIEEQFKLAIRSNLPMGFIMLDIDNFKNINDSYGHLLGDKIIIQVAECAKNILQRSTDHVFRYGGDEFLITLYDTDLEGVKKMALTLKETLANQKMTTPDGDVLEAITLSMGLVSEIPDIHTGPEAFIKKADDALYLAKREGKNCIVHRGEVIDR